MSGKYAILSGTSMATPFVAGASALLLEVRGKTKDTARSARDLFETTSVPVRSDVSNTSFLQTITQQGAGLLNVYNAVHYTTQITPGELLLNDTSTFDGKHTINIYNSGKRTRSYTLSHDPAGTALTMNGTMASPGPVPLASQYATVRFSQSKVTVHPNMTSVVTVQFQPPKDVDATAFPVYSGFIRIDSDNDEHLSVSYLGLAADIGDMEVLDQSSDYFSNFTLPALFDKDGKPQLEDNKVYTLEGKDNIQIIYRLNSATPRIIFDLVSADSEATEELGFFKRFWRYVSRAVADGHDSPDSVPIVGRIAEMKYIVRNTVNG